LSLKFLTPFKGRDSIGLRSTQFFCEAQNPLKVLVVGSGGREHALVWALAKSGEVSQIYCAPGNAGIAQQAELVPLRADDVHALAAFAEEKGVGLTVAGGETSLAAGIADHFAARGLPLFGPTQAAAQLEASKAFAKDFMARHGVPTARYRVAASPAAALEILRGGYFGGPHAPVVVKADGLAAGKGVIMANTRREAEIAIHDLMVGHAVGHDAGRRVVLEETLTGREVSLLLFSDGRDYALMPPARDHKRIGEGDTGPNTGGMGTFTAPDLLDETTQNRIVREIVEPTLAGAAAEGFAFRGALFLGLMLTADGPRLLEYNARFGDPEAQSILVRLESDFPSVCRAVVNQSLARTRVSWRAGASACVVLAARGYPGKVETGAQIHGLAAAQRPDTVIFHAGTARGPAGEWFAAGGRVLGVTATGADLRHALQRSYAAAADIAWDGLQYRRDIGQPALP
jgi:phosphoribosylamine--glycine ligase